jgi:hypothetical protein
MAEEGFQVQHDKERQDENGLPPPLVLYAQDMSRQMERRAVEAERDKEDYYETFVTNASAGSLNSGIRGFRAELHGISNLPYFFYRVCKIYG